MRLLRRFFWSLVTLLGVAVVTFILVNAVPGDVAHIIAGPKASAQVIHQIHVRYHLDDPMWKRLGYYLAQLAHGDLGYSFVTEQSVAQAILTRLPTTASLAVLAVTFWMVVSVPTGIATAKHDPARRHFGR